MLADSPQSLFIVFFYFLLTAATISTVYELFSGEARDRHGYVVHKANEEPFMFALNIIVKIVGIIFFWVMLGHMHR